MPKLPSPSLAISMVALVIALGGAGYSATGGNFILGQSNVASTETGLSATLSGRAARITNSSTSTAATALGLFVKPGRAPMTVNSATRVTNLNADLLDGINSNQFARVQVIPFTLGPGASTSPIALPANRPVLVMGATLTENYRGIGQVTVLRTPGASGFIAWTGLEPPFSSSITNGWSATTGAHIVYTDNGNGVDIEVSGPDAIRVRNTYPSTTHTGTITLIW